MKCPACGQVKPISEYYVKANGNLQSYCKTCNKKRLTAHFYAHPETNRIRIKKCVTKINALLEVKYAELLRLTDFKCKPMTEKEWLEICRYFDGCAICGDPYIEARDFLILFQDGGKYVPWNIIPKCGKCATQMRKVSNVFQWLRTGATRCGINKERREKLIKFMYEQIERYKSAQQDTSVQELHSEPGNTV